MFADDIIKLNRKEQKANRSRGGRGGRGRPGSGELTFIILIKRGEC